MRSVLSGMILYIDMDTSEEECVSGGRSCEVKCGDKNKAIDDRCDRMDGRVFTTRMVYMVDCEPVDV